MALLPIVSPDYCYPNPIELSIKRIVRLLGPGELVVKDINGNSMFKVKTKIKAFGPEWRTLLDPAGNPIVTLRAKATSSRGRWEVFRGGSTDNRDLILSVRRHSLFTNSIFHPRTLLDVFLANNTSEEACDFQIKGGYNDWTCTIYAGNHHSNSVVAEMHKAGIGFCGNDKFMVTIQPNIDHAFIVALIVILDEN